MSSEWNLSASKTALRTKNPIRGLVDTMKIVPNPDKEVIKLSLGDPAVYGNLPFPAVLKDILKDCVEEGNAGYVPATGTVAARQAVCEKYAKAGIPVGEDDVCLASGCSHALQIAMSILCDPGDNVILPAPGFAVYQTIADYLGVGVKYYSLNPKTNWEVDLDSLKAQIDANTKAILINNPSNPCGSVFSKDHLEKIVAIAEEAHLPIIADEIYADMVFKGETFTPAALVSKHVPVITCGGLAKQYLVPGYRVGWLALHDRDGLFEKGNLRTAMRNLSQVLIGSNTLVQSAIPRLLKETPESFYTDTMSQLENNAKIAMEALSKIDGLHPVKPAGAMYMMIGVDVNELDVDSDVEFSEKLFSEQSVFVLPGQCFQIPNFFRIVLCAPGHMIEEAVGRMGDFCSQHASAKKAKTEE